MPNEWVAVDAGTNRLSWARLLRRADAARDVAGEAGGPLPPSSWAPAILELRRRLEGAVAPVPVAG